MAETIYALCAVASLVCAGLLLRGWRTSRARLLLWSSICFAWLAVNNVVLLVDKVVVPDVDLVLVRALTALAGFAVLLYGLIWDAR
jgi:hypothetical protein